jgi:hypothetical protein
VVAPVAAPVLTPTPTPSTSPPLASPPAPPTGPAPAPASQLQNVLFWSFSQLQHHQYVSFMFCHVNNTSDSFMMLIINLR